MDNIMNQKPCNTCNADRQIENPDTWQCECDRCTKIGQWRNEAIIRLSEIEDILGDYYDLDRIKELVEADRDGRCVVLPCKVGDTVKIDASTWGNIWNFQTIEQGKFLVGEIIAIIKTKKQTLIKIRAKHNVEWKRPTKRYPASAIGKTVFLSPETAEAALKGEQDG